MIKKIGKLFIGKQDGFTLIEMIVVIAISSFICVGLVMSIHSIMFGSNDAREGMRSIQYTQNTGNWLRQDLLMSQSIQSGDIPETPEYETITLNWTSASYKDAQDNERIDYHEISYCLDDQELQRNEYITTKVYNPNGSLLDIIGNQSTTLISDNISSFTVNSDNGTLAFSLTALVGDAETEQTYEIFPRALDRFN
jgi:prepilin-type N-terminal cleavage/methylation domain-containing protein